MAYFPNGTSGEVFDEQCSRCRYGEGYCPIAAVQYDFNYDACNVPVARKILDHLVKDDGTCAMFALDPATFTAPPEQGEIVPHSAQVLRAHEECREGGCTERCEPLTCRKVIRSIVNDPKVPISISVSARRSCQRRPDDNSEVRP